MQYRKTRILIEILVWWIICSTVFITIGFIESDKGQFDLATVLMRYLPIAAITSIYIVGHFQLLYLRFFESKNYSRYLIYLILLIGCTILADAIFVLNIHKQMHGIWKTVPDALPSSIMRVLLFYTPVCLIYTFIRGNLRLQQRKNILEKQAAQQSIALLKEQIKPHFLFNTLNTIYGIALAENASQTAKGLDELSGLFRYAVETTNETEITIEKELSFIDKYLHLQNLRIDGAKIAVDTQINWDRTPATIAPMLLIPFIENMFKYGISYTSKSSLCLKINVTNGVLSMECVNDIIHSQEGNATGIQNTLSRLQILYPRKHKYKQHTDNNQYVVYLKIDLTA